MSRITALTIVVVTGLMLSGCISSPWSAGSATSAGGAAPPSNSASPTSTPTMSAALAPPTVPRSNAQACAEPDAKAMQDIMAELRAVGAVDPAARDRLVEDLRQTDPSLWPLVMRQVRATAAYRCRARQSEQNATGVAPPALMASPSDGATRLPMVGNAALLPTAPPQEVRTAASQAAMTVYPLRPEQSPIPTWPDRPVSDVPGAVFQASCTTPAASEYQQRLAATIESLERELPANPSTPADATQHARLRMLYLLAGRNIDALRPIPTSCDAAQKFWATEMAGLATWLDAEHIPDDCLRAAEVKPMLAEAESKLSELAPLAIRNLSFCTEVRSFGGVKRFEKNEFAQNQEILLYAEVENFFSEPTPQGYRTSLHSSYQIVDAIGQSVAKQDFPPTEEHCRNVRRDFFIGYRLRMPKTIQPGKYVLQLTIEDLLCRKVGWASIDFSAKEECAAKPKKG